MRYWCDTKLHRDPVESGGLPVSPVAAGRRLRWSLFIAVVVVCGVLVTSSTGSAAQKRAGRGAEGWRDNVTLDVSPIASRQWAAAEDFIEDRQYAAGIAVLQQLIEEHGRTLIPVTDAADSISRLYSNLAIESHRLLASLPAEGLQLYRERVEAAAARLWAEYEQRRDPEILRRLLQQYYCSRWGDDALWELAEISWKQGRITEARDLWRQLLEVDGDRPPRLRYPNSSYPADQVQVRLRLAELCLNPPSPSAGLLNRRVEPLASRPNAAGLELNDPDVIVRLGMDRGPIAETLAGVTRAAESWTRPRLDGDVLTFASDATRSKVLPDPIDVGSPVWSAPLPASTLPLVGVQRMLRDRGPLSYFPVVHGNAVFVADADGIRGWNMLTGEPAWPREGEGPAGSGVDPALIYPPVAAESGLPPLVSSVGVPRYTLTVSGGRLFARMGSPVTALSGSESRLQASELVCLDLQESQGRLIWRTTPQDLPELSNDWSFEGTPVVIADQVFVVVSRRRPQVELRVLCLDVDTGTLVWSQSAIAAQQALGAEHNRISHLLLTWGDGRLFLNTDLGAVVALDPRSGSLQWAMTYRHDSQRLAPGRLDGLVPCVYADGRVFAAPNDADQLFCLDAVTGRRLWQVSPSEKTRPRSLLGVHGNLLIGQGDALVAFRVDSAGLEWSTGGDSDPQERGYGQGLLCDRYVYYTTREELRLVEVETGEIVRRLPLGWKSPDETGGNLVLSQGILLVAQPDRLTAYCDYGLLKQRLRIALQESPRDPLLLFSFAEAARNSGDRQAAVAAYAKVMEQPLAIPPWLVGQTRARWRGCLMALATTAQANQQPQEAIRCWRQALDLTEVPAQQLELMRALLRAAEQLTDQRTTFETLQQILDSPALSAVRLDDDEDAGLWAARELARRFDQPLPDEIAAVWQRVAGEFEQWLARPQELTVNARWQQYPFVPRAIEIGLASARELWATGEYVAAGRVYRRLLQMPWTADAQRPIALEWVERLHGEGLTDEAYRVWLRVELGRLFPRSDVVEEPSESERPATTEESLAQDAADPSSDPASARTDGSTKQAPSSAARDSIVSQTRRWRAWGQRLSLPEAHAVTESPLWSRQWTRSLAPDETKVRLPMVPGELLVIQPASGDGLGNAIGPSLLSGGAQSPIVTAGNRGTVGREHGTESRSQELVLWFGQQQLEAIRSADGATAWKVSLPQKPLWVSRRGLIIVLVTRAEMRALQANDGRLLWRQRLPRSEAERGRWECVLEGSRVLVFSPLARLQAYDLESGQPLWQFAPERGQLQPGWVLGADQVVLQTHQPAQVISVAMSTGKILALDGGPASRWLTAGLIPRPAAVRGAGDLAWIDSELHWGRSSGDLSRVPAIPVTATHAPPRLLTHPQGFFLASDGHALSRLDPRSLQTQWSVALRKIPARSWLGPQAMTGDLAIEVDHGVGTAVSLETGKTVWQQVWSRDPRPAQLRVCGSVVVIAPEASPNRAGEWPLLIADLRSGALLQSLRVPTRSETIELRANGSQVVVIQGTELTAFAAGEPGDGRFAAN